MMQMSVTMHPIWQSGAVALAVAVIGALLLQMLVQRVLPVDLRREHTALGSTIFAVIGTTYAVLLAFMATTAWEQYSAAQALARHEADLPAASTMPATASPTRRGLHCAPTSRPISRRSSTSSGPPRSPGMRCRLPSRSWRTSSRRCWR